MVKWSIINLPKSKNTSVVKQSTLPPQRREGASFSKGNVLLTGLHKLEYSFGTVSWT